MVAKETLKIFSETADQKFGQFPKDITNFKHNWGEQSRGMFNNASTHS